MKQVSVSNDEVDVDKMMMVVVVLLPVVVFPCDRFGEKEK